MHLKIHRINNIRLEYKIYNLYTYYGAFYIKKEANIITNLYDYQVVNALPYYLEKAPGC